MANSQLEIKEIDDLQVVQRLGELQIAQRSDDASSSLSTTELLHHLVDVSRVLEKKQLLKTNSDLINKLLLTSAIEPIANEIAPKSPAKSAEESAWNEMLVKKLIAGKVDPTNTKVKELANKLTDELVRYASSMTRTEDKATFEVDTKVWPLTYQIARKTVSLRGLVFDLALYYGTTYPAMYLLIECKDFPVDKFCKTRVELRVKSEDGQSDWIRRFSKMFTAPVARKVYKAFQKPNQFSVSSVIKSEEYAEEFGLTNDGRLTMEVAIRIEQLADLEADTIVA